MENLKFEFLHPVKGLIRILNRLNPSANKTIPLDIQANQCYTIPYNELPAGKCKVRVEWEYNGQEFTYERNIHLIKGKDQKVFNIASN